MKCIICTEIILFITAKSSENNVIDRIDIDISCSKNNSFTEIL